MKRFHVHIHVDDLNGSLGMPWPGHPASAHWGYPDPSEGGVSDAQKEEAFRKTMHTMKRRLGLLINLPASKLAKSVLQGAARDLASH